MSFPADGDAGFLMTDDLVITFDQPMDEESVKEAYSSEHVLLQNVTFSFSEDKTILTIDPADDLLFGEGEKLEEVQKVAYSFVLGTGAKSAAGVAIEEAWEVEFTTARGIVQVLSGQNELAGSVRSTGDSFPTIWVGDSAFELEDESDSHYVGVVSFDMDELPADVVAFESATISMTQALNAGTPYLSLGTEFLPAAIFAFDVDYGSEKTWSSVSAGLGVALGSLSTALDEVVSLDVTDALNVDYQGGAFSQFAFRFTVTTDEDDAPDNVELSNPELTVLYFVP